MRQMIEMFQWPKCHNKKWRKCLSENKPAVWCAYMAESTTAWSCQINYTLIVTLQPRKTISLMILVC